MGGGERAPHVCGHHSYPQLAKQPVGQKISKIYRDRIGQFYSRGQWDKVNLLSYVSVRWVEVERLLLWYLWGEHGNQTNNTLSHTQ